MSSVNNTNDINEIVKAAAIDGHISCTRAIELSNETGFTPAEIGSAMNDNKIRITHCQLGLFGHAGKKPVKPAETVDKKIEDSIKSNLDNGRISCKMVWQIADEMRIKRFDMACACEKMNIRINKCQLGAF